MTYAKVAHFRSSSDFGYSRNQIGAQRLSRDSTKPSFFKKKLTNFWMG
jgi:hypothetical protein